MYYTITILLSYLIILSNSFNLLQLPLEDRGNYCSVYFDIDSHYLEGVELKESKLIKCQTLSVINKSINIWNHQVSFPKIYLQGIHYHNDLRFNYNTSILNEYGKFIGQFSDDQQDLNGNQITSLYLRGDNQPAGTETCINFLLSRDPNSKSAYGKAYLGKLPISERSGGVCDTRVNKNKHTLTNIAMASIGTHYEYNAYKKLLTIILHEIGHSMGSDHDCCIDNKCDQCYLDVDSLSCKKLDNPYIMNPTVSTGKNKDTFSKCSLDYIANLTSYSDRKSCLVQQDQ